MMPIIFLVFFFLAMAIVAAIIGTRHGKKATEARIDDYRNRGLLPPPGIPLSDIQLKQLVSAGEKILAIKIYRENHPELTLVEAKAAVEQLFAKSVI